MSKNRFFDSSSSDEDSDDEQKVQVQTTKRNNGQGLVTSYIINSNNDENVKRISRSGKEKRNEEMEENIKKVKQAMRIRDVNRVHECFKNLIKAYDKARRVVTQEQTMPRFYIKILVQLDDFVNQCWSDEKWRDTLNKTNSNHLSALRQKFRRYLKQELVEKEIEAYRKEPDDEESEIDQSASSDEDEVVSIKSKEDDDNENDPNESFWDDEPTSPSINTDLQPIERYVEFIKDKSVQNQSATSNIRPPKENKPKPPVPRLNEEESDDTPPEDDSQTLVTLGKDEEITEEVILKKLNEIIAMRGKRETNHENQLQSLNILRQHVEKQNLGVAIDIQILLIQITISFDCHHKGNEHLKLETWTHTLDSIEELLKLLSDRQNEVMQTIYDDTINIILRMDEEFTRILQTTDAHSRHYLERLKDELRICSIIDQFKILLEFQHNDDHLCTIYMCIIEHVYYKYDKTPDQSSIALMNQLCKFIYANDTFNRARARASLCHVYHLAIHDHYREARDLMLMCHMQDTISSSDISTQILYNRTIVQLGLCAFRFGAIREAHQALVDIQSGNRVKELLGQGVHLMHNQETKESQYLLPFHMHINLEVIECVYLVSAMLIEVPFMASKFAVYQKRPISKHFYVLMRQAEKQPVFGPSESMREHVISASYAIKTGDWNACVNFLINDKMNSKVWNLMSQATEVREMLTNKIKEESLRIYLFTYATIFDTIAMSTLADMFELSIKQVHSLICKMIINEELMASLEEDNQTVKMHQKDSSRTQALSLQLIKKTFQIYEQNDKLVNVRTGGTDLYSRSDQH